MLDRKTRPKHWWWSRIWLTSGCISACISASCTALGTWNLSISSIILATRLVPPCSRKQTAARRSFRRFTAEIVCVWSQTRNNLRGSPVASLIPAGSMSTVVWPVGWRWLHHPLPGRVSQAMVRVPRRGPLKRNRVVLSRVGNLDWRHDDVSESHRSPKTIPKRNSIWILEFLVGITMRKDESCW